MAQKYTENKKVSNRKWDAANLDRLSIALPKGRGNAIKVHAAARGESVNGFIGRAIRETMARDSVESTQNAVERTDGGGNVSIPDGTETPSKVAQNGEQGA